MRCATTDRKLLRRSAGELRLDWPETSPGRSNIRHADLRTFFISPTFGLNLSRWAPGLSLGLGVDLVPASVRLERDILFGTDAGSVALSGPARPW